MNVLDEDIDHIQRNLLIASRTHFKQIGVEIGHAGMKDRDDVIPLLHGLRNPTFFSRDHGFYKPALCHNRYCLVYLDVAFNEVADHLRRFLRHPHFRTQSTRIGKVFRVRHSGLSYWQMNLNNERYVSW